MAQAINGVFSNQLRRFYQQFGLVRHLCNSHGKDLATRHVLPTGTDFLYNNLKHATCTKSVLDIVSAHSPIMNNKHVMQALRSLFTLQKQGNSNLSTKEILGHRDFKKLCRQLRSQAPTIELNETIEALKVVCYVGVPSDSNIVQVLLQLIRHNVNSLSLQQIIFLDFLLSQLKSSPLVDALQIALPIVFQIQLPVKMEYENASHLADYLYFASKNSLNEDSVEKIVNALMKHHTFDAQTAKSIVWSICSMENNSMFRPLIKRAIDSLVVHLDELNFNDMETTLTKLIARYSKKWNYFYDETFYDSCASYVIDKDLGYAQSVYLLRKFARVVNWNYCNNVLLDYMAKKIHENPELIAKGDPVEIYSIAVSVALTDYRPVFWDHLKELISKTENIASVDRKEILWIKFGAALCLLDIYKLDVLTKCLNETFLKNLFKKKYMSDFECYAVIWQCIKLFKPELNCLLSSKLAPDVIITQFKQPLEFPLETALHKALGGETYVKTDLYSKMGHQIDHAFVLRKGGYPVAMNYSNVEFVEEIEVQPDNQLVVILGLRYYHYILNNRRPRCSTLLSIKVLESKGYSVVPVCLEVWESLPDFEKIPYLMRSIKEKTDTDWNISESIM